MANSSDTNPTSSWNAWFREWLATIVVVVSLVAVAILGGLAIKSEAASSKEILTMVLPMIGTWVGTVLAFYFGKEQLEAATRSVTSIARELTPDEKLRSIKVIEKMIPRALMFVCSGEPSALKLLDSIAALEQANKGSRIPVLTKEDFPLLVVHRSTIDQFIVKATTDGKTADELKALTLDDLLHDQRSKELLDRSFAVVPETSVLADVKRAMASLSSQCQDAFVTRSGSRNEPVTGWVTNVIIEANSQV